MSARLLYEELKRTVSEIEESGGELDNSDMYDYLGRDKVILQSPHGGKVLHSENDRLPYIDFGYAEVIRDK